MLQERYAYLHDPNFSISFLFFAGYRLSCTLIVSHACAHFTGGLAREQIRDSLPPSENPDDPWWTFNASALFHPPLGLEPSKDVQKQALYFPRPEIVPNVPAGTYRYTYTPSTSTLSTDTAPWQLPEDDARAILESQLLSLRLRSRNIVAPHQHRSSSGAGGSGSGSSQTHELPAQPRRIYLVGGGSSNFAIQNLVGEVLGGAEGVYKLDVGGNACALGSAYKAVWACERASGETFEELIGSRWDEEGFVEKVGEGYCESLFELYEKGVEGLERVERDVLEQRKAPVRGAGTSGAGQVE